MARRASSSDRPTRTSSPPRWTLRTVMARLKSLGTAQNVKVYRRHGAGDNVFGVSFANLRQLKKEIGTDHELAIALWETGNSDARSLAMMIVDPQRLRSAQVDTWARSVVFYINGSELADVVAQSPLAVKKLKQWCGRKQELVKAAGYAVVCSVLRHRPELLSDDDCRKVIDTIRYEIHDSPNRARHTMSLAVIAVATARPELASYALEAGEAIGPVRVDHGETSCKTPQIVAAVRKLMKRKAAARVKHVC